MDLLNSSPAVLIALVSAIVGLIVKAVRLQAKVDDLSKERIEDHAAIAALGVEVRAHCINENIHFNLRISQEVDKRNEQRFVTIEGQLREIKELVRANGK